MDVYPVTQHQLYGHIIRGLSLGAFLTSLGYGGCPYAPHASTTSPRGWDVFTTWHHHHTRQRYEYRHPNRSQYVKNKSRSHIISVGCATHVSPQWRGGLALHQMDSHGEFHGKMRGRPLYHWGRGHSVGGEVFSQYAVTPQWSLTASVEHLRPRHARDTYNPMVVFPSGLYAHVGQAYSTQWGVAWRTVRGNIHMYSHAHWTWQHARAKRLQYGGRRLPCTCIVRPFLTLGVGVKYGLTSRFHPLVEISGKKATRKPAPMKNLPQKWGYKVGVGGHYYGTNWTITSMLHHSRTTVPGKGWGVMVTVTRHFPSKT